MDGKGHFPGESRPRSSPPPMTRALTPPIPIQAPRAPAKTEPPRAAPSYGIARAVELLRRLPPGDRAVLVDVVKMALESAQVRVESIIDDATKRGSEIDARIEVLRQEVAQREEEIATRREEIANLETEQDEITHVKDQLSAVREEPIEEKAASNDEEPAL